MMKSSKIKMMKRMRGMKLRTILIYRRLRLVISTSRTLIQRSMPLLAVRNLEERRDQTEAEEEEEVAEEEAVVVEATVPGVEGEGIEGRREDLRGDRREEEAKDRRLKLLNPTVQLILFPFPRALRV